MNYSTKVFPAYAKAICWALCIACMALIFWFSSRTATESSAQSDIFVELFKSIFGDNNVTDFIVRKAAHFSEFAGLGLLFAVAFYVQFGKRKIPFALLCASAYAVTDEVHQIFVEGRACKFTDWVIDTAGALLGVLVVFAAVLIAERTKKRGGEGN